MWLIKQTKKQKAGILFSTEDPGSSTLNAVFNRPCLKLVLKYTKSLDLG